MFKSIISATITAIALLQVPAFTESAKAQTPLSIEDFGPWVEIDESLRTRDVIERQFYNPNPIEISRRTRTITVLYYNDWKFDRYFKTLTYSGTLTPIKLNCSTGYVRPMVFRYDGVTTNDGLYVEPNGTVRTSIGMYVKFPFNSENSRQKIVSGGSLWISYNPSKKEHNDLTAEVCEAAGFIPLFRGPGI